MNFKAEIKLNGINPYVLVSASRAQRIQAGWKKPMPVLVQVNGKPEQTWGVNMMPVGDGAFYLYLGGRRPQGLGDAGGRQGEHFRRVRRQLPGRASAWHAARVGCAP